MPGYLSGVGTISNSHPHAIGVGMIFILWVYIQNMPAWS